MPRYPEAGAAQLNTVAGFVDTANEAFKAGRTEELLDFALPDIYRAIRRLFDVMGERAILEGEPEVPHQ